MKKNLYLVQILNHMTREFETLKLGSDPLHLSRDMAIITCTYLLKQRFPNIVPVMVNQNQFCDAASPMLGEKCYGCILEI